MSPCNDQCSIDEQLVTSMLQLCLSFQPDAGDKIYAKYMIACLAFSVIKNTPLAGHFRAHELEGLLCACVQLEGKPVGSAVVGADGKFNIPFTAPAKPGDYPVLTTFTPAGASSPAATAPATLTVSPPTGASLALSLIPNVLGPNGLGALGGTVTLGSGSPDGGSVEFTVRPFPPPSYSYYTFSSP